MYSVAPKQFRNMNNIITNDIEIFIFIYSIKIISSTYLRIARLLSSDDKNRVKVKSADEETSDYINASYIKVEVMSFLSF